MIHVAYRLWGGDGFYATLCGTSMLSMFENTKEEVTVHIMHNDRLTHLNRGRFHYIAEQYNQHIEFHNVEKIAGETLRKFEAIYPIESGVNASWYPLITHEVFPDLDKLIFLGADTLFNMDVKEMWDFELNEDFPFGAVSEYSQREFRFGINNLCKDGYVRHNDYFNSDFLIFNPKIFLRYAENLLDITKFLSRNITRYCLFENDVLTFFASKYFTRLPTKFNICLVFINNKMLSDQYILSDQNTLVEAMYHFEGKDFKPGLDSDNIFNHLFLEYFMKTPWATPEMFGSMDKEIKKIFNKNQSIYKTGLLHFTNLLAYRERAFFVEKIHMNEMKEIFYIRKDELVIEASDTESLNLLLKSLIESRPKKIFIIWIDCYNLMKEVLSNFKFVEWVDFIDARIFFTERQGVVPNFDTHPIFQAI